MYKWGVICRGVWLPTKSKRRHWNPETGVTVGSELLWMLGTELKSSRRVVPFQQLIKYYF